MLFLDVICRLLRTAKGLQELFCVCNFADYVKVPQIPPATFQRMVNKLVRDIDGCEGYNYR